MSVFRVFRSGSCAGGKARRRRRTAISSEQLETRTLLSTFFVNGETGSDLNDGSADAPFQTIQRGVDFASLNPGDDEIIVEPMLTRAYGDFTIIRSNPNAIDPPDGNLVIRGATGDAADVRIEGVSTKFFNTAQFDVTIADMTLSGGNYGVINRGSGTTVIENLLIQNTAVIGVVAANGDTIVRNTQISGASTGILVNRSPNVNVTDIPRTISVEDTTLTSMRGSGIVTEMLTGAVTLTNVTADNNS